VGGIIILPLGEELVKKEEEEKLIMNPAIKLAGVSPSVHRRAIRLGSPIGLVYTYLNDDLAYQ